MIRLEYLRCSQGCRGEHLSLDFGTWGQGVTGGCGGPYRVARVVDDLREISAPLRRRIQEVLGELCAARRVDRDEAEAFLDRLFRSAA